MQRIYAGFGEREEEEDIVVYTVFPILRFAIATRCGGQIQFKYSCHWLLSNIPLDISL